MNEKLEAVAEAMRKASERTQIRESLKNHWLQSFGVLATKNTLSLLSRYAQEHGVKAVCAWIDDASINEIPANQALRYITAIRPKKDLEDDF